MENNWAKLVKGRDSQPTPTNLLAAPEPPAPVVRAKSARDLFIAAHPEIRDATRQRVHAEGVIRQSDVVGAINKAYTAAIQEAKKKGAFSAFEAEAQAAKLAAADKRRADPQPSSSASKLTAASSAEGSPAEARVEYVTVATSTQPR